MQAAAQTEREGVKNDTGKEVSKMLYYTCRFS